MRTIRYIALTALLVTTAFVSSGPPWISVEYPANPYDGASRGAFLLVHAFHHGTPVAFPVSGTAEGLLDGARRTISLEFKATSRPGVYAVHKQWPDNGIWTLVLAVTQGGDGDGNTAKAVVELGTNGQVASVSVPTRRQGQWVVPAPVSMTDIESALRARAARIASRD
jgi:hypothetical protein